MRKLLIGQVNGTESSGAENIFLFFSTSILTIILISAYNTGTDKKKKALSPSDFSSAIETDSNFASRLIEREWNGRSTDKIIKWTQHIPFRLESNLIQYNSIFSKKLQRCQISKLSVKYDTICRLLEIIWIPSLPFNSFWRNFIF